MIESVSKYCNYCNIYISTKLAQLLWRIGPTCEVVGTNPDEEDCFLQSFLCIMLDSPKFVHFLFCVWERMSPMVKSCYLSLNTS